MGKIGRDIFKQMLITNNLSAEKTISGYVEDYHRAFNGMCFVDERWYCFYTYTVGTHHTFTGVIVCKYSDDYGDTWSDEIEIHSGQEILDAHPQWLIDEPRTVVDARDCKCLLMPDDNILITVTVVMGYNWIAGDTDPADPLNVDIREITQPYYTVALRIPIDESADGMDLDNMEINHITETGGSICSMTLHDEVVYQPCYGYPTEYGREMKLYKSLDYGVTWSYVAIIIERADEGAIYFIGETMYVAERPVDNGIPGIRKKSTDYGLTWDDGVNNPIRLDGLWGIEMPNNSVFIHGRENEYVYKTTGYVLKGETLNSPILRLKEAACMDTGYGTTLKHGDKYYISYHDGIKRTFGTYKYPTGWTGIYFKEINVNIFELLAY